MQISKIPRLDVVNNIRILFINIKLLTLGLKFQNPEEETKLLKESRKLSEEADTEKE